MSDARAGFSHRPAASTGQALKTRRGFLGLCTIDDLGQVILCRRDCPVHHRMFNSIPGPPTRDQ